MKAALVKCATGLLASEVVEEYAVVDGELKLVKKKVTKKQIPPDVKAVRLLLEERGAPTDEELEEEYPKKRSVMESV